MSECQQIPDTMLVTVAGQDCTQSLGAEIAAAARNLNAPGIRDRIAGESAILELGTTANESEFLDRHLTLFGNRTQVALADFNLPNSGKGLGRIAGLIRGVLWRLMRHPHDWTVFHQNTINLQAVRTLELEVRLRRREASELRKRLTALEARCNHLESTPS